MFVNGLDSKEWKGIVKTQESSVLLWLLHLNSNIRGFCFFLKDWRMSFHRSLPHSHRCLLHSSSEGQSCVGQSAFQSTVTDVLPAAHMALWNRCSLLWSGSMLDAPCSLPKGTRVGKKSFIIHLHCKLQRAFCVCFHVGLKILKGIQVLELILGLSIVKLTWQYCFNGG